MTQLWRAFNDIIPLFLLIALFLIGIGYFLYRSRRKQIASHYAMKSFVVDIFLTLSVIGILLVTVFPRHWGIPSTIQLVPFIDSYNIFLNSVDMSVPIRNIGFNVLLFVPFGFFLTWRLSPHSSLIRTFMVGVTLSLLIEITQFLVPMGRSASTDDIIINAIGTLLGVWILKFARNISPEMFSPQTIYWRSDIAHSNKTIH